MVQYVHIYAAICIMIKLKVMFWKLYTRIYFNVGTFNMCLTPENYNLFVFGGKVSFIYITYMISQHA